VNKIAGLDIGASNAFITLTEERYMAIYDEHYMTIILTISTVKH